MASATKADLKEAERLQKETIDLIAQVKRDTETCSEDLAEKKTGKSRAVGELDAAKGRLQQSAHLRDRTKKDLEGRQAEVAALKQQIADAEANEQAENRDRMIAEAAKARLASTRESLRLVREEIEALESEEAKRAAIEAEGAELPTDVVPAPTPQVPPLEGSLDFRQLWSMNSDGVVGSEGTGTASDGSATGDLKQIPHELRVAFQSETVLAALQRTLCIRAAELREALRQWGFALLATRRTEELTREFEASTLDGHRQASDMATEFSKYAEDKIGDNRALSQLREDLGSHREALADCTASLRGEQASVIDQTARRDESKRVLDAASRELDQLSFEHAEMDKALETRRQLSERHPIESSRRSSAAEKLALQAEDQARKGLAQLAQTQRELVSFQAARASVLEFHMAMGDELEAKKRALEELREEHANLNLELNGLARYYLDQLPRLPGIMGMPSETAPVAPEDLQQEVDALVLAPGKTRLHAVHNLVAGIR
jgi:chromosome segregation ATPase